MLRIAKSFSLDDFEGGLQAVAAGETVLQIPHQVRANAVGSLAALMQLVVTWSRQAGESSQLRLHALAVDDPALKSFAHTPFGVVAINMAKAIELANGLSIGRRDALIQARDYVLTMHGGALGKLREFDKSALSIICIDNANEYRRPVRLYVPGTNQVRSRRDFEDLIHSCLETLRPNLALTELDSKVEAIAALVHEAFQNTDDHAQTDFNEVRLRRSSRGILIGYSYVLIEQLPRMAGAHAPLKEYFAHWRARGSSKHAQFVEVSVFDSGPGLAQNWLAKTVGLSSGIVADNVSLEEEYKAVRDCLRKGGTTKAGGTSGNGLFRIMGVVKRSGGFVRIRTGRLSLVKAFNGQDSNRITESDLVMDDMVNGGRPMETRAWADGTVITAMLPLNRAVVP
jgi:hypothetical protein